MSRLHIKICVALMVLASQAVMAAAPTPQKVAEVEGISEYRLANGLRVLLFPDQSKATITVNVTYLVGSRHESYGETGMAHLLEHMLFKGHAQPRRRCEGVQCARCALQRHHLAGSNQLLRDACRPVTTTCDWALGMEADRMVNSLIARKDLDTEMSVVRNEVRSGEKRPDNVLFKRLLATAYDWHNYGNAHHRQRARISRTFRHHPSAGFLSDLLPAGQRHPAGSRQFGRQALQLVAAALARSRVLNASCHNCGRSTRAGW